MEYKVRKGIENPCKIHGLLVRDFYLLLGYGGFAVAVLLLNVKSWLEDGTTGGEMLFIFVLLVGCGLLLARKFYKNASRKKYRPPHWEKTVTNRDVRNALMKDRQTIDSMESVRNWLEQTIGMPIDYICIIIMGMLTLHVLIRIAIHGNMEFLKKYGKSGHDTEKKSMIPLKKGTTHRLHDSTFF